VDVAADIQEPVIYIYYIYSTDIYNDPKILNILNIFVSSNDI